VLDPKDVNPYCADRTLPTRPSARRSAIRCISFDQFDGALNLGYKLINFRWGAMLARFQISPARTLAGGEQYYKEYQPIPIRMCCRRPPACNAARVSGFRVCILPMAATRSHAGALACAPIPSLKCRTVDAYTLSDAMGGGDWAGRLCVPRDSEPALRDWQFEEAACMPLPFHPMVGHMGQP